MCTVSLVPVGDRLRLLCNRDERYTRPSARPPAVTHAGDHLALLPLDPQGGGTWIAATGAGLVFAVLNGGASGAPGLSRGRLILELLDSASLDDAIHGARGLCRRDWPGHRLVVADADRVLELRVGLAGLQLREHASSRPLLFTSSSIDDERAVTARSALFEQMVVQAADPHDGQEAFHRHRWRDRPDLSVHMRRHDSATQSMTMVEITRAAVRMRYESTTELVGVPAMLSVERVPCCPSRSRWTSSAHGVEAGVASAVPVLAAAS